MNMNTNPNTITVMTKNTYLVPETEVIELKPEGNLLQGSDINSQSVEGLIVVEGEWVL